MSDEDRLAALERRNAELWAINERLASSAAAAPALTGQVIARLEEDLALARELELAAYLACHEAREERDAALEAEVLARSTQEALATAVRDASAREAQLAADLHEARAGAEAGWGRYHALRRRRVVRLALWLARLRPGRG
jgi:hypothetical protein